MWCARLKTLQSSFTAAALQEHRKGYCFQILILTPCPADRGNKPDVQAGRQDAGCNADLPRIRAWGLHTFNACQRRQVPADTEVQSGKLCQTPQKHRPNFIAGVPTLYEALLRIKSLDRVDLSCLKGVFSGGDSLSIELKKRFDKFLKDHNASIPVREGYGTTECVTASCLTPVNRYKEGSIGLPFPDTFYKIVKPGTEEEVPYGEEGEICLSGPTVMIEYINNPEETANTLRRHKDGLKWIHTGDLGMMDEEGFVYFRQRIKRMIITSGYNVSVQDRKHPGCSRTGPHELCHRCA